MSLLLRLAIGKQGEAKERATKLLNQSDMGKHEAFNAKLEAEIEAKLLKQALKDSK